MNKRQKSDKGLRDKSCKIASNSEYDAYERGLASIMYTLLKSKDSGVATTANEFLSNQQLANEFNKPIIRKYFKKYSSFKENIWGADLVDIQLISKCNNGIRYLLYVINLFSKYAWVVPWKDRKGITITDAFQSILYSSKRKPSKIWVDQSSEFYNNSFKNG